MLREKLASINPSARAPLHPYDRCTALWVESGTVSITAVIPRLPRKNRGNGNKTGSNTAVAVIFLGITTVAVKILTTAVTAVYRGNK